MINTIYPQVVDKVLNTCEEYLKKECSAKQLQEIIYWAEHSIVNIEEKDLRKFMMNIEGDIDSVRATENGVNLGREEIPEIENREKMLEIVNKIKNKLNSDQEDLAISA